MRWGVKRRRLGAVRPAGRAQQPRTPGLNRGRDSGASGQSLTEFALVVPFLLILLLTIGDFGRYYAAGIRVESIARTAAEEAAQEYVRAPTPIDYSAIHADAWQSVCDEANGMPNVTYNGAGTQCEGIATLVCVHDGTDPGCTTVYNNASGVPAGCPDISAAISSAQTGGSETSKYVEVRVCYRFSTILPLKIPFVGGQLSPLSGDFYIQRIRTFTVADY